MFGFPLVFWHSLYASCFDTTLEEFGEERAQDTETFCDHLVGRILGCVDLRVSALDTLFLVIGSVAAVLGHVEGTGEDAEKGKRTEEADRTRD
jgi:hypothetical protein